MSRFDTRMWGRWALTFVGFPLAGLAARGAVGPIDGAAAAAVGGLAAGLVLGGVQSFAFPLSSARRLRWSASTAIGMSVGLVAGSSAVAHATDTASLVVMGALTGAGVGIAQSAVLDGPVWRRAVWAIATPLLWALGWLMTAAVISDVEAQYANFGASGAVVCAAIGGGILAYRPRRSRVPTG